MTVCRPNIYAWYPYIRIIISWFQIIRLLNVFVYVCFVYIDHKPVLILIRKKLPIIKSNLFHPRATNQSDRGRLINTETFRNFIPNGYQFTKTRVILVWWQLLKAVCQNVYAISFFHFTTAEIVGVLYTLTLYLPNTRHPSPHPPLTTLKQVQYNIVDIRVLECLRFT